MNPSTTLLLPLKKYQGRPLGRISSFLFGGTTYREPLLETSFEIACYDLSGSLDHLGAFSRVGSSSARDWGLDASGVKFLPISLKMRHVARNVIQTDKFGSLGVTSTNACVKKCCTLDQDNVLIWAQAGWLRTVDTEPPDTNRLGRYPPTFALREVTNTLFVVPLRQTVASREGGALAALAEAHSSQSMEYEQNSRCGAIPGSDAAVHDQQHFGVLNKGQSWTGLAAMSGDRVLILGSDLTRGTSDSYGAIYPQYLSVVSLFSEEERPFRHDFPFRQKTAARDKKYGDILRVPNTSRVVLSGPKSRMFEITPADIRLLGDCGPESSCRHFVVTRGNLLLANGFDESLSDFILSAYDLRSNPNNLLFRLGRSKRKPESVTSVLETSPNKIVTSKWKRGRGLKTDEFVSLWDCRNPRRAVDSVRLSYRRTKKYDISDKPFLHAAGLGRFFVDLPDEDEGDRGRQLWSCEPLRRLKRCPEISKRTIFSLDWLDLEEEEGEVESREQAEQEKLVSILHSVGLDNERVVGWFRREKIEFGQLPRIIQMEDVLRVPFPALGDRLRFVQACESAFDGINADQIDDDEEGTPLSLARPVTAETFMDLQCPLAQNAHRVAVVGLNIPNAVFDHRYSTCFCSHCAQSRGEGKVKTRLVGGRRSTYPHGWVKLGLSVSDVAVRVKKAFEWPIAFHGFRPGSVCAIASSGENGLLCPGLVTSTGRYLRVRPGNIDYKKLFPKWIVKGSPDEEKREALKAFCRSVFFSPSLKYSLLYSSPFDFEERRYEFVFQVRVRPGAFSDSLPVPPFSRGQRHTVRRFCDPLFPRGCFEWFTDRQHVVILTGLLVREISK